MGSAKGKVGGVVAVVVALAAATACGAPEAEGEAGAIAQGAMVLAPDDAPGSGLRPGLVTGRIYADLAKNADARMRDFRALGVSVLRLEVENATPMATYKTVVSAARRNGIDVLALVTKHTVVGSPDPMAGTRGDFEARYVPRFVAAVDRVHRELGVRYVEVWNEPDVYSFLPMYSWTPQTGCVPREGAYRFSLLATRVYETMLERRAKGERTPTILSFSFSRQDDACLRTSVFDSEPIENHRAFKRSKGLPDGLPADIVAIHGYGNEGVIPGEPGYTYAPGGTFEDGVKELLGARFARDGASVIASAPVWYTEVGFCEKAGIDSARQAEALTRAFDTLARYPQVTAAFAYSYRDDEPGGSERCGLRASSTRRFAEKPAYAAFKALATKLSAR